MPRRVESLSGNQLRVVALLHALPKGDRPLECLCPESNLMLCEAANETAIDIRTASGRLVNGLFTHFPNSASRFAGYDRHV
jgi:hypothetical protein